MSAEQYKSIACGGVDVEWNMVPQVRIFLKFAAIYVALLTTVVAYGARRTDQKLLDFKVKDNGSATLRLQMGNTAQPSLLNISLQGTLMGQKIDQTWGEADLEEMKKSGHPRTVLKYRALDVLTFLAEKDFNMYGGGIRVGYLRAFGDMRSVVGHLKFDAGSKRWWLIYNSADRGPVKLQSLSVELRTSPVLGPIGIKRVEGVDDAGKAFEIPAD